MAGSGLLMDLDDDVFDGNGPIHKWFEQKKPTFNKMFRKCQATSSLKKLSEPKVKKKKSSLSSATKLKKNKA
jgi:ATP-dependent exoDNAse (exonuclease V) alpha subunit